MNTLFKYKKKLGKELAYTNKSIVAVRSKLNKTDKRQQAIIKALKSASIAINEVDFELGINNGALEIRRIG